MLSRQFLITIVGIIVAILAICNLDFKNQQVAEHWWGSTSFTPTAVPGAMVNGQVTAIGGNYLDPKAMLGSNKFVSVPSYQAVLSPRFSNVQYGANIRYNTPDRENMGAPCNPLTFGDMAQENYQRVPQQKIPGAGQRVQNGGSKENYCGGGSGDCANGSPPSCGKGGYGLGHKVAGGYELPPGYTNGNYQDVYNSLPGTVVSSPCGGGGGSSSADLPIGTMSSMDSAGNTDQFIAFNRIMPANSKGSSRLYAAGDFIRGDLPIVPCQSGWFSVYPTIPRDVNPGALGVVTGAGGGGESYNKLMQLLVNASGGVTTTLGGVDLKESLANYNVNMASQNIANLSSAMTDVSYTSFP